MIYFALIPPTVAFLLTFGVVPFFPHHAWWLGGWLACGHRVYRSWYLVLPTMVVGARHCHGTHRAYLWLFLGFCTLDLQRELVFGTPSLLELQDASRLLILA